jgi:hypothetical protein
MVGNKKCCWWGDRGGTGASREQETMMVNMTLRQTNLTPRLTPSLLTDHMTPNGIPKRPLSMKGQRWKHIVVEEEKEEGMTCIEKMKHIYRGVMVKKRVGGHNYRQKTCKNTFFNLTTAQNV